jgi:uncharacterized membrane protein HdeD (DUF308 family)
LLVVAVGLIALLLALWLFVLFIESIVITIGIILGMVWLLGGAASKQWDRDHQTTKTETRYFDRETGNTYDEYGNRVTW